MSSSEIRETVKKLRLSILGPDGTAISQTEFGRLINKSLNTVQRYETLVPPRGKALMPLKRLAEEKGRFDLAKIFQDAFMSELGGVEGSITTWQYRVDQALQALIQIDSSGLSGADREKLRKARLELTLVLNGLYESQPAAEIIEGSPS